MQLFLEGKKTWIGILMLVIGTAGWGDIISADVAGQVFDLITQLIGLGITIYGNYKSHQKIGALERTLAGRM